MMSGGTSASSSGLSNHTTTIITNNNNGNTINDNNNMPLIQQHQQQQSSAFFTPSQVVSNTSRDTMPTSNIGEYPPHTSSHVGIVGISTSSLLPPLAKSTPIMTTSTLNGSATNPSHSVLSSASGLVPIAPASTVVATNNNNNTHTNLLSIPPHTSSSDHYIDHSKNVPSSHPSMIVSSIPSNSSKTELMPQARPPLPVHIGFMPPISLCVLMDQMASKIHQHNQTQKQASSSKKPSSQIPAATPPESQKKESGEPSNTLNSPTEEDSKKTESMLTDDKTNSQSNETTTITANVISTSRNVPSTNQGRSKSPGSSSSLFDILNEEYHSNYANYQELTHATNLIIEFLYGNTDLKERYLPLHSQFSSQQQLNWVYLQPSPIDQPVMYPNVPRSAQPIVGSTSNTGVAGQYSTPVKSATRGMTTRVVGSDTTPGASLGFKSGGGSSATFTHDPLEIPPPVFAMPKPSNGSEASTPIRVRVAPNSNNTSVGVPIPEHQHISPFPIRAREDEAMEDDKRKRRVNKKPESAEGGDEQENRFICYICDKSVVDKSTKYTLTSSNFSSFHEVFPHLRTPLLGESKRICANCYHKKYRNSRKKKADDRKDVISQGSSNVMSVDAQSENFEPNYCCCVCKKNGGDDFNETNFVNHQNYRSYITNFPFIAETPTADRPLPVCDSCHEKYLQAEASQERKRKLMLLPTSADTLESLNKKLKPDTSHL